MVREDTFRAQDPKDRELGVRMSYNGCAYVLIVS